MKKRMWALAFCWIALLGMLFQWVQPVWADTKYPEGPQVYAEGYFVIDGDTGEVLAAKNADERLYPASITKVLTALIVLEKCTNLDEKLTFTDAAFTGIDSHSSHINPLPVVGEQMTVRDALYGLILVSCNISANALAVHVAGSLADFADMMNAKAKEIGAADSHFMNPSGLHHDNHYTTPHDMLMIFKAAMENEMFAKIDSTLTYQMSGTNRCGSRALTMSHQMINGQYVCDGVYAGKTGRTNEAQRTLLTAAMRNGRHVLTIIMKSDEFQYYNDTKVLIDYAFDRIFQVADEYTWTKYNDQVWATGKVNVREFDNPYSAIVGCLTPGESYCRLAQYMNWVKILYQGKEYYVSASYLSSTDPSGGTVTPVAVETREPVVETTAQETETESESDTETEQSQQESTTVSEQIEKKSGGSSVWLWILLVVLILISIGCIVLLVMTMYYDRRSAWRRRRRRF